MTPKDTSNGTESFAHLCRSRHHGCSKEILLGSEVGTRVGDEALGVNGLASSTAIGILIEHDIALVFHELGKKSDHSLSGRRKREG